MVSPFRRHRRWDILLSVSALAFLGGCTGILADRDGRILYGGFVGWIHTKGLNQAINKIRQDYS